MQILPKRKEEQIRLINSIETKHKLDIIDCDYENDKYEELVKNNHSDPEGGNRCRICFKLRLEKTAQLAKELNYDYFCSTLTVSPYKNSVIINQIGEELEKKEERINEIINKILY